MQTAAAIQHFQVTSSHQTSFAATAIESDRCLVTYFWRWWLMITTTAILGCWVQWCRYATQRIVQTARGRRYRRSSSREIRVRRRRCKGCRIYRTAKMVHLCDWSDTQRSFQTTKWSLNFKTKTSSSLVVTLGGGKWKYLPVVWYMAQLLRNGYFRTSEIHAVKKGNPNLQLTFKVNKKEWSYMRGALMI